MPALLFVPLLFAVIVLAAACRSGGEDRTIVLYGFSIMEDVMKKDVIPAFQARWKQQTGEDVRIITSFAGSGSITNLIALGAPAQVAMVATELDAVHIRQAGMVSTDWREFRDHGTFAHSVVCIVTRKHNPRGILSFEDLARPGVDVMYPDPTTSGGAQWSILALYGSAMKAEEMALGSTAPTSPRELLKRVTLNAGSMPESARRALTQFGLGYGDALLTYENEALVDIANGRDYEVIVPESTILIEPKVLVVDRNVDEADMVRVRAFVEFLWSDEAQEAFVRSNFRVSDERIMERYLGRYQEVELPFTVAFLGGWEAATAEVIEGTWKEVQREIQ